MKAPANNKILSLLAIAAGLLCAAARFFLYAFGYDEQGLMENTHFLHLLCWIVAAGFSAYTALTLWKAKLPAAYEENFLSGRSMMFLAVLVPLWFLASAFETPELVTDRLTLSRAVLSFAVVPCFAVTCWFQNRGKRPVFLLHGIICIFFMVDMICRYRPWSGNPQLADYSFHLMACIFLTLTAYHRTAFDVDLSSPGMFRFCSLMAIFFCFGSLVGPEDAQFYIGGALWAVSGLCPSEPSAQPVPEAGEGGNA